MNVWWSLLLAALSVPGPSESRCSPTSYYKNCWIRRFPGIFIDIAESQRRGAQLLRLYPEDTALKCSRTCCLTRNFSCNLAIFHYDASPDNVNCFHLHCPSLESCILSHRGNAVLYNVTKGVDPDLLVFGKYFTSNVRVLPHHYGRANVSEPLPSDKRQFIHPPPPPAPPLSSASAATPPTTLATTTTTTTPTPVTSAQTTPAPTTTPSSTPPPPPPDQETHVATTTFSSTPPPPDQKTHVATTTPSSTPPSTTHQETHVATSTITSTLSSMTDPTLGRHPPTSTLRPTTITSSSSQSAATRSTGSSKQHPNDTKSPLGRNHTAGGHGGQEAGGDDTQVGQEWHAAANTILVAAAIGITVLLSCCCSVLLVASWRGQRKRMGRYRTSWRGKRGSMRLIKYVLVRESS